MLTILSKGNRLPHSINYPYGSTLKNTIRISFDADALAYFTRSGVSASEVTWKNAFNALILAWKAHGLYDGIVAGWIHAAPDSTTALHNIKSASFTATLENAPTFTALEGFTGNAINALIDYHFNLATNGGLIYTRNNAGFSLYQRKASPNNGGIWFGIAAGGSATILRNNGTNIDFDVNNSGVDGSNPNLTRAAGWTVTRKTSTNVLLYQHGLLTENDTINSSVPISLDVTGLALRTGVGSHALYSDCQLSIVTIHKGFDATECLNYDTDIEAFMDAIGKGVQ